METSFNKIFLTGLPGCGKSTLGKEIASKSDFQFVDLDNVIEDRAGMTIPEVFSQWGEARFREIERASLEEVIDRKGKHVIATGGGAPCFFDNMELMNQNGLTIYMNVPVEELMTRIKNDSVNIRPLMGSNEADKILARLKTLKNDREKYYKMANMIIAPDFTANNILSKISN